MYIPLGDFCLPDILFGGFLVAVWTRGPSPFQPLFNANVPKEMATAQRGNPEKEKKKSKHSFLKF